MPDSPDSYGCRNDLADQDNCSSSTVLTDDDFDYGGATYTVGQIVLRSGALFLSFDGVGGAQAKTALSALTLWVDGSKYTVSSAGTTAITVLWSFSPTWSDEQTVSLTLTE